MLNENGRFSPHIKRREVTYHRASRLQFRRNPNQRMIGVELEINNCGVKNKGKKLAQAIEKWKDSVVSDGSIGAMPDAFEINCMPSSGDLFLDHIREVTDGLAALEAKPNEKCGMHVHVDATDLKFWDLRRVIDLYAKVERAIYDLCHPRRLTSDYARICGNFYKVGGAMAQKMKNKAIAQVYTNAAKTGEVVSPEKLERLTPTEPQAFKHGLLAQLYNDGESFETKGYSGREKGEEIKALRKEKYHRNRYKSLNLHSFFLRGTIEFRHHEGVADYDTVTNFALVCAELISAAHRMSERQIAELPRNPRKALLAVLPERLHAAVQARWAVNDEIIKQSPEYQRQRKQKWGI